MVYTVSFLVIVVIVSGFIAYWGDLLGRRMGKRRLTLFGMRPKHTAIVVTTITGMVIAALVLATMLIASSSLRRLVMDGDHILRENWSLTNRNAALKKDLSGLQKREEAAVKGADDAKKAETIAETKAAGLQSEVEKRSTQLDAVKAQYGQATSELSSKQQELADTATRLDETAALAKHYASLASGEYGNRVNKTVIVQRGEEISRSVIRPSAGARRDVLLLLNNASRRISGRGAGVGKNGRTIYILPKKLVWAPAKGQAQSRLVSEDDSIAAIVRGISSYSGEVVAIVRALGNTVQGEQVPVEVFLYRNKLAFHKGDDVAWTTIDGSVSQIRVMNALAGFMKKDVRNAAKQAGMIPVFDPENPEAMFGDLSGAQFDQFMAVVKQIQETGSRAMVRVIAQQDIKVAERMDLSNLRFVVGKSSVNASG